MQPRPRSPPPLTDVAPASAADSRRPRFAVGLLSGEAAATFCSSASIARERRSAALRSSLAMADWGYCGETGERYRVWEDRFFTWVGISLMQSGRLWIFYLALEPSFRRFWPDGLISWTRLLCPATGAIRSWVARSRRVCRGSGNGVPARFRDADGDVAGLSGALSVGRREMETLLGTGWFIAVLATILANETAVGLMVLFLFLLLSTTLRSRWAGATVLVLVGAVPDTLASGSWFVVAAYLRMSMTLGLFALWRFGLVAALIVTGVIFRVFQFYPFYRHLGLVLRHWLRRPS